jgi:hypothetical protein
MGRLYLASGRGARAVGLKIWKAAISTVENAPVDPFGRCRAGSRGLSFAKARGLLPRLPHAMICKREEAQPRSLASRALRVQKRLNVVEGASYREPHTIKLLSASISGASAIPVAWRC